MDNEYSLLAEEFQKRFHIQKINPVTMEVSEAPQAQYDYRAFVELVMPIAEMAGISFDEIVTLTEYLVVNRGHGFNQVATELRSLISDVISSDGPLNEIFRTVGFSSGFEAIKLYGLRGAIALLNRFEDLMQPSASRLFNSTYSLLAVRGILGS